MAGRRLSDDADIARVLDEAHRIVVVGASRKPERPSHRIFTYLREQGYEVIPVNPSGGEIDGVAVVPSLEQVEGPVHIVDVFRNPADLDPSIVDQAVRLGAKVLWLQDGVVRDDIAELAQRAGLDVVMDDCIMRRHQGLNYCQI